MSNLEGGKALKRGFSLPLGAAADTVGLTAIVAKRNISDFIGDSRISDRFQHGTQGCIIAHRTRLAISMMTYRPAAFSARLQCATAAAGSSP
jgi:hypothetical protein